VDVLITSGHAEVSRRRTKSKDAEVLLRFAGTGVLQSDGMDPRQTTHRTQEAGPTSLWSCDSSIKFHECHLEKRNCKGMPSPRQACARPEPGLGLHLQKVQ
jgi:hypothetical protein